MKLSFVAYLAIAALMGTSASAQSAPSSSAAPNTKIDPAAGLIPSAASVNGFRSAWFGRDETAVRQAITADFHLPLTAIHTAQNPIQRTDVLSVTVPNLISDTGKASLNYVFGYHSHKLIEVNVSWSTSNDAANSAPVLVRAGTLLQSYFENEGFPPDKSTVNAVLRNGAVILFRGVDPQGHAVVLILTGPLKKDGKDHQVRMTPATLALVYAEDPTHPDVFQLPTGNF